MADPDVKGKEDEMGRAPEIQGSAQEARHRVKWVLDPATGQIQPKEEPTPEPEPGQAPPQPRPRPTPIQAAYQVYD